MCNCIEKPRKSSGCLDFNFPVGALWRSGSPDPPEVTLGSSGGPGGLCGALGQLWETLAELWEALGEIWEGLEELWEALGELWEGLEELGAQYFSKKVKKWFTNSPIGPRSTRFSKKR